eukprot:4025250-Amphidinium_carterae.1
MSAMPPPECASSAHASPPQQQQRLRNFTWCHLMWLERCLLAASHEGCTTFVLATLTWKSIV